MTEQVTGVIAQVRKDRKGFKLDNDMWYSCYKTSMLGSANAGDSVAFQMKKNGDWNNVVGVVEVVGQGHLPPDASAGGAQTSAAVWQPPFYQKNLGYLVKTFPVPAKHPDRSIIRQNCMAHATALVCAGCTADEEAADAVIKLARTFEAYATGALDEDTIANALKQTDV